MSTDIEKEKIRDQKIDKFLDTMTWYFRERTTPTGFYSTIGRIEQKLEQLNKNAEEFNKNVKEASKSSDKLTAALNKITLAGVVIAGLGILLAVASLGFETFKFFKGG